jgi:hypothetical protein
MFNLGFRYVDRDGFYHQRIEFKCGCVLTVNCWLTNPDKSRIAGHTCLCANLDHAFYDMWYRLPDGSHLQGKRKHPEQTDAPEQCRCPSWFVAQYARHLGHCPKRNA